MPEFSPIHNGFSPIHGTGFESHVDHTPQQHSTPTSSPDHHIGHQLAGLMQSRAPTPGGMPVPTPRQFGQSPTHMHSPFPAWAGAAGHAAAQFLPPQFAAPVNMAANLADAAAGHGSVSQAMFQMGNAAQQHHLTNGIDAQGDQTMAMTNFIAQKKMEMMANETIANMAVDGVSTVKKIMEKQ